MSFAYFKTLKLNNVYCLSSNHYVANHVGMMNLLILV